MAISVEMRTETICVDADDAGIACETFVCCERSTPNLLGTEYSECDVAGLKGKVWDYDT